MWFIIFKNKYEFKIGKEIITVDPVERIRNGLKSTTLRLKRKRMGLYFIRQGNYFKPNIPKDFYLRFVKREARTILSLTPGEIQIDLGLTDREFNVIRKYNPNLHSFFLNGIRKINRNSAIKKTDLVYLHYFNKIVRVVKDIPKQATLEAYF